MSLALQKISQREGEISSFESQLTKQEKIISGQEQKISQQRGEFLKQTKPEALTIKRQSLLAQSFGVGGVSEGAKKIKQQKIELRKKQLPKFETAKTELKKSRIQTQSERARLQPIKHELHEIKEFEIGRKLAGQEFGIFTLGGSLQRKGYVSGIRAQRAAEQRLALFKVGKPLYDKGILIGFEKDQMTIRLQDLDTTSLVKLEKAGVLTLTRSTPSPTDFISQGMELAKTLPTTGGIFFKPGEAGLGKEEYKVSPLSFLQQPQPFDISKIEPRVSKVEDRPRRPVGLMEKGVKVLQAVPLRTPLSVSPLGYVPTETKVKGAMFTSEILFGKSGEQFMGFKITPQLFPLDIKPDVTFREIKEAGKQFKIPEKEKVAKTISFVTQSTPLADLSLFKSDRKIREKAVSVGLTGTEIGVRGISEFAPTTPGGTAFFVATPFALGKVAVKIPKITKTVFGGMGIHKGVEIFKPGLTIEERATIGVEAGLFGAGALLTPTKFQHGVKMQKAQIGSLLEKKFISEETATRLLEGVKLQKFFRKQPDVPPIVEVTKAFPPGLTLVEQEAFAGVALEGRIFGSQATRLRGLQELGGDIDIAFKQNRQILNELQATLGKVSTSLVVKKGEAIGLAKLPEKSFDIKAIERLEAFPFFEKKVVDIPGGGEISKLSEQFSRTLSGLFELRKGGKDIGGAIISGRGMIEHSLKELPKFPGVKQFKQFQLRKAEAKLMEFEKAVPEISLIVQKTGVSEIAPFETRLGALVPMVEKPPLFPPSKRGALGTISIEIPKRQPAFDMPSLKKQAFGEVVKQPKVFGLETKFMKPSKIPRTKLTPSKFKPFVVTPKIKPSIFQPIAKQIGESFIPITPQTELIPSIFEFPEPSKFKTPPIDIKPSIIITPPPTIKEDVFETFEPTKIRRKKTAERKKIKKIVRKKRKKKVIIRPSFTGIITGLETAAKVTKIGGIDIGIAPGTIRGLETGFKVTKKKKKSGKKKSSKKKPKIKTKLITF